MANDYFEKLRDPRWQKVRLEIMQRDDFTCVYCGSKTDMLNVHHGYYEYGKDPWDYPQGTLWTLCEDCHGFTRDQLHDLHREIGAIHPSRFHELMDAILGIQTSQAKE